MTRVGFEGAAQKGPGMGLDEAGLRAEKLDVNLKRVLEDQVAPEMIPVIVQTVDGLQDEDRSLVEQLNGSFKDDLWIIQAFSADLPPKAIDTLILSPRVVKVYHDAKVG